MLIRLFAGYDDRESHGFGVFLRSLARGSKDYWLRPLSGNQADGTNAFTYERFYIPDYCNWSGFAIFVDGADMLLKAPLQELWDLRDHRYAVQVVKHAYKTKHARKYIGTEMEADNADYPRKNWSSVVIWNCGHRAHFDHRAEIRKALAEHDGAYLHRFGWLRDEEIGELPKEWNWLADEYGDNQDAKLLHWTAGMPGFPYYANAPMAAEWHALARTFPSER